MNFIPLDQHKKEKYQQILRKIGYEETDKIFEVLSLFYIEDKEERDFKIDEFIINNPNHFIGYYIKAFINIEEYKSKQAILNFTKVIELKPDLAEAYYSRGVVYSNILDYDNAIRDYKKAIDMKTDYADAYNRRGLAYHNKKEYHKAIDDYTKAIMLIPFYISAYNSRGWTYLIIGDYERAIIDFEKALELNYNDVIVHMNLITALILNKYYEKALVNISNSYLLKLENKDKVVIKCLECIVNKALGNCTDELEKEFNELIKEKFEVEIPFDEIDKIIIDSELSEDIKEYIREKTELLKKKIKK